jgi:hypothetical protein
MKTIYVPQLYWDNLQWNSKPLNQPWTVSRLDEVACLASSSRATMRMTCESLVATLSTGHDSPTQALQSWPCESQMARWIVERASAGHTSMASLSYDRTTDDTSAGSELILINMNKELNENNLIPIHGRMNPYSIHTSNKIMFIPQTTPQPGAEWISARICIKFWTLNSEKWEVYF